MEALVQQLLLTLGLAFLVLLLALFRRSTGHTRRRRTIVVRDPAIAKLTLIDHADAFSNRPTEHFPKGFNGTHSVNSAPHGPVWRALRCNLTSDILHPTRLRHVAQLQQEAAEALVADLSTRVAAAAAAGGEEAVVVLRDTLHAAVFALTARLCFGDGVVGERYVRAIEREVLQFMFTFVHDSVFFTGSSWMTRLRHRRRWQRYSGTFDRVYKLVSPIIIAARKQKQTRRTTNGGIGIRCYVDSLLDLHVPDDSDATTGSKRRPRLLTDKEMVRLVFEFLGANTESVVACVEWTLARLVIRPEVQKKLHREITGIQQEKGMLLVSDSEERLLHRLPYLRAVILESLRLHAPVPIMRDVSAKDVALAGTPESADGRPATVITDIHKIGRNKEVWTDPDEFHPERFLPGGEAEGVGPVPGPKEIKMAPFGVGRRYCPGIGLGMLHVGCILTALVREFQWALTVDDDSVDLKEFRAFFTMMKTPLRARITPREFNLL